MLCLLKNTPKLDYNNKLKHRQVHGVLFGLMILHLQIAKLYYAFCMHKIRFEPSGRQAEITEGDTILTAAGRAGILIVAPCGGRGVCRKCMVDIDGRAVLACLHQPAGDEVVTVPGFHPADDASERRAADYIRREIMRGGLRSESLLAIDLGTTGVSVAWIDVESGEIRHGKSRNRQAVYGADVLSRIMMTEEEDATGRVTMQKLARESIAEAINQLGEIHTATSVTISANPTMVFLLLGKDASSLRKSHSSQMSIQFAAVPANDSLGNLERVAQNAKVQILPGAANYLGGDVLVGLALARRFHPGINKYLFIDAGTNGEIVLVVDDVILGIATSAGPAFEGGEVNAGIPAMPGAIETVHIKPPEFWCEYGTICNLPPAGICGSGIIELVAELDRAGALDRNGRIKREMTGDAFADDAFGRSYVLVPAKTGETGRAIYVSDADLGAIINTKAAIFAGCRKLTSAAGITFNELDRIFIAGDFGYHINVKDAISTGMLPDVDVDKYIFMGNASLAGAAIAGMVPSFFTETENIMRQTTFLDLGEDTGFMEEYMAARFLPHTNIELFPHSFRHQS